MAEQLALEQPRGDGGAVELDEGAVLAAAVVVDGAGDEFFAGAGLAQQQDGGVAWGDGLDELEDVAERGAVADDLVEVQLGADLVFEVELLLGELLFESEISRYASAFSTAIAI